MPYIFIPLHWLLFLCESASSILSILTIHVDIYLLRVCLNFFMYNALINMDGYCLLIDLVFKFEAIVFCVPL